MTARARPEPRDRDPSEHPDGGDILRGEVVGARDRGQAAPLMVVMLLVLTVAVAATVEIGRFLDESARARTAADAAALAGAAAGRSGAASLAAANGGRLLSYTEQEAGGDSDVLLVTVAVEVGRASQSARAERSVEWTAPPDATHN